MIVLRVVLMLAVAAAMVPEVGRYAAERRLFEASAIVRSVFARPRESRAPASVEAWALSAASAVAAERPRDWRALNLAGSACLLAGQPDRALDWYRQASAAGERPEIDLNLGRAYAALGQGDRAAAAFLRGSWISPALQSGLPAAVSAGLGPQLRALERALVAGRLAAPPALPP